jgi:hypothetical protein
MLIAIITINKLQIHQIDVKVTLLNGVLMIRFTEITRGVCYQWKRKESL